MRFKVMWDGGATEFSPQYNNGDIHSFDLTKYPIPEGAEVYPHIHVLLGKNVDGEKVIYKKNAGNQADYHVSGSTQRVVVELQ